MLVDERLKNHAPQNDRGDVVALILSLAYTTVGRSYAIAELSDRSSAPSKCCLRWG